MGESARRRKKPANRYHHGDLRRALLEEALRTIQAEGVEQLTLRAIGERLGVSRTALYRHFSDKQALLAAVGREGFRTLRDALQKAWSGHGDEVKRFAAMARAYVTFAVTHPAHYRVMFGGFVESCAKDAEFVEHAAGAFDVLVNSIVEQQTAGLIRRDDPQMLAQYIWATVHGTAMLAIDGQLSGGDQQLKALTEYVTERIRASVRVE